MCCHTLMFASLWLQWTHTLWLTVFPLSDGAFDGNENAFRREKEPCQFPMEIYKSTTEAWVFLTSNLFLIPATFKSCNLLVWFYNERSATFHADFTATDPVALVICSDYLLLFLKACPENPPDATTPAHLTAEEICFSNQTSHQTHSLP